MEFPDIVPRKMPNSTMLAVQVRNAVKNYGCGTKVLNHLDMNVEQGSIYTLLGSSGSGKTTLLSCIVGLKHLDEGEVKVYGARPGSSESGIPGRTIGFMPQDIALYEIFSIKETLCYYGQIYGMTNTEIISRMEFLTNFLHLPDTNSYIKNLSGGQKRRASLAVAMIHQPKLLILDEPTVGVDPLLRVRIWNHLTEMVSFQKTTVLITTHYTEEARHSDRIGLMSRHGKLLTESNPKALLEQYKSNLLEDVVLKLCRNDTISEKCENSERKKSNALNQINLELAQIVVEKSHINSINNTEKSDIKTLVVGIKYQKLAPEHDELELKKKTNLVKAVIQNSLEEYNKVSAVLKRNFLCHFRHPVFVLVQLIIPTLQIILFNYIMGAEPCGLKIGVVNNEISTNQTFLEYCENRRRNNNSCFGEGLSCAYLEMFENNQVNWYQMSSENEALESVQQGETMGYISIPNDFSGQLQSKILLRNFASVETLIHSTISIRLDFSRKMNSAYLVKEFHEKYLNFIQEVVRKCNQDQRAVEVPLKLDAIYGSLEGDWKQFFQPAFILWIIFLLPTAVGIFHVGDIKAGTLNRTLVAGVRFRHILVSVLICEGAMTFLQLTLCFVVLLFGFGFKVVGSLVLCIFLSFLMGMVGVTLGLLIGTLCKHEMEVIMSVACIYMITIPASGGVWPLAGVIPWYKIVSYAVPITLPLESIRSVVNRGWGLEHGVVLQGILVMIGWITVCCLLSAIFHRLRK